MSDQKVNMDNTFASIKMCIDEIADSHGYERCALICTLVQLMETVRIGYKQTKDEYQKQIDSLSQKLEEAIKKENSTL